MKILILANYDVGLYQFRKELIEELLKTNKVTISLPYGELVEPLKEMGCHFIDTPLERRGMNPLKDAKLFFTYLKIFRQEKPDLVITYTIKPNVYGGFAARVTRTPYAVNITGLGTAFQNNGMLRKVVTLMYKVGCKKAKVVFFENVENRDTFINNGIVEKKQTCLLNGAGVNLEHFKVLDYPKDDDATRFLFIGRVMKEKGIEELLASMKKLVGEGLKCSLDIVGPCEENYKGIIEQYEAEGWLRYHGFQTDVRPFIKECHCFVLPSWHEGMANTNLECAASGRPVITSRIHGCMEAVEDGVSGYLCERQNEESLYGAMKRFLATSNEERKALGQHGNERMRREFDKRMVVKKTLAFLTTN